MHWMDERRAMMMPAFAWMQKEAMAASPFDWIERGAFMMAQAYLPLAFAWTKEEEGTTTVSLPAFA